MGSGISASLPSGTLQALKESKEWLNDDQLTDDQILSKLQSSVDHLLIKDYYHNDTDKFTQERGVELASKSSRSSNNTTNNNNFHNETILDSIYLKSWLSKDEADVLFEHLVEIGLPLKEKMDQMQAKGVDIKYPLTTITYGSKRKLDGALALDRWGSYHESWCRVEEPSDCMNKVAKKMRDYLGLPEYALNSMVVNYYWDGASTHIPAHRDTIACLEENSKIHCLSLGATREFILCDNKDAGKYIKSDLKIHRSWDVSHGDLFALGAVTNEKYCHCIPSDTRVQSLRISIIFRTVTKSFIDFSPSAVPIKSAVYANDKVKEYQAECVLTTGLDDIGKRTHIADLIQTREDKKRAKMMVPACPTPCSAAQTASTPEPIPTLSHKSTKLSKVDLPTPDLTPPSSLKSNDDNNNNSSSIKLQTPAATDNIPALSSRSLFKLRMLDQEKRDQYFMGRGMEVPV